MPLLKYIQFSLFYLQYYDSIILEYPKIEIKSIATINTANIIKFILCENFILVPSKFCPEYVIIKHLEIFY